MQINGYLCQSKANKLIKNEEIIYLPSLFYMPWNPFGM